MILIFWNLKYNEKVETVVKRIQKKRLMSSPILIKRFFIC